MRTVALAAALVAASFSRADAGPLRRPTKVIVVPVAGPFTIGIIPIRVRR